VASNSGPQHVESSLKKTGLWKYFNGRIFTAEEVARCKPAPDVYLHAAQKLGYEPSQCVVVEDSAVGVRAAKAAGMTVFAYTRLSRAAELRELGAICFESMSQLPELFLEYCALYPERR
jgi:beta-phosphoglucomutase-like phosphatase (HAD superfamily)